MAGAELLAEQIDASVAAHKTTGEQLSFNKSGCLLRPGPTHY